MKFLQIFSVLFGVIMVFSCQKQITPSSKEIDQNFSSAITSQINLNEKDNNLSVSVKKGLLASYPFSGNANDASGNGNNGTINGAVLTTDRFNKKNSAYSFDGISNSIIISNFTQSPSLFSISLWFYPTANGHFGTRELLHRCDPTNVQNYCWNLSWGYANSSQGNYLVSGIYTNTPNWNYDGNNLQLNQWYNAIMTYDGINKKVYLNGILISSTPITGQINYQNKTGIYLGYDSYWDFYQGKIDDIRIYSRALTAQEASYLASN